MGTSLATKKPGTPDNTYQWYLHNSGETLAAGYAISLGDGSDLPIMVKTGLLGVKNASGFTHWINSLATAERTLTIPDTNGKIRPLDVVVLASDHTNSTTTATTVPSFSYTLEASTKYEFEMVLIVSSAGGGVAPRFVINGPSAEADLVYYEIGDAGATEANYTDFGSNINNAKNPPAADTDYVIYIRGILKMGGTTPSSDVTLQLFSEVASTEVRLRADSEMRFRKLL